VPFAKRAFDSAVASERHAVLTGDSPVGSGFNTALVEKSPDAHFLREMIGFAAERLMEIEVAALTGAGHGEKSPERLVQRNGYRVRDWETRAGTVELRNPEAAQGLVFSGFSEAVRMAEKAFTAVVQEAYIQGISTRSVDDLVKAIGMSGVCKKPGIAVLRGDRRAHLF
jgi:putative transposase